MWDTALARRPKDPSVMRTLLYTVACLCFFSGKPLLAQEAADGLFSTATADFVDRNGASRSVTYHLDKREDGAWRLSIDKEQLTNRNIDFVDVKLPAANAKTGEDGYFITTTSAIGTFRKQDGIYRTSRNYYAFFGMKTPRVTWVAIVKKLNLEFDFVVQARDGEYEVFPRFCIGRMGFPPYENIVVDFYPLRADASYADMAKTYRQYQLGRGEVKPLKERMADNPALRRMARSILCRVAHGGKPIPKDSNGRKIAKDYTLDTELPMRVYTTCDEATECIKALKQMGCDYIDFHEVGWNIRGHDGRYPQLFPVEPSIGGEAGLRETIKTAKECGYYISAHTNNTDAYKIADCWSEDYIAKRKDGSLMRVGCWAGGTAYTPCPQAVFERFIKDDYEKLRDLGFNGLHHVDVISAIPPRECHDPDHPLNRREWAGAYLRIMKHAHDVFGGFTSECGFDHVARYLDFAFYINHSCEVRSEMLDRYLPIWQVVYHGIIPSSAFFSDTNGSRKKEAKVIRLHHAEFGGRPVFYGGWTKLENLHSVKETYDEYQKVSYLQLEFMEDHKPLAENVYLTVYGDGSEVLTNYTQEAFLYRGKTVGPEDYLLFPGSGPTQ